MSLFKFKKKEPLKSMSIMDYGNEHRTHDMTKDEVYELLKQHIDNYHFTKSQLAKLERPEIDAEYKEVLLEIVSDACDGNINTENYMHYSGKYGIDPGTLRKLYFRLGEYLSSIVSFGENKEMFERNLKNEEKYIAYLQNKLGIGI